MQDIKIDKIITHADFIRSKKINDIALIHLKTNAILDNIINVKTICLPETPEQDIENINDGQELFMTVSGWGQTETSNQQSDDLLYGTVPYVNHSDCEMKFEAVVNVHPLARNELPRLDMSFLVNLSQKIVAVFRLDN